jgi:hypothetical protein
MSVSSILTLPTQNRQDQRVNLYETCKKTKNQPKTRPNNTPQDPLGSQEGINTIIPPQQQGKKEGKSKEKDHTENHPKS